MFGFHNGLDLRRILIEQFDYVLAKDAGDRKDDNLGNVIINEYFINNDLNILFTLQNYNQGDPNSVSRVVIKTGKGFRNVL